MIQAPGAPGVAARLAQIGAALALLVAGSADAQGLNLNKDSGQPVEINADQGIEWRRDDNVYIARGNASAKQGDVTVHADTLTAHYHPVEGGGTDIYQLDAIGNVVINSANGTASGDNGVYDVGNALMVLKGRALKMVSEDYTVTARDSLEYWDNKQMAVARGNAVVVNEDKRLSGSIVTAYFTPSGSQSESRSESGGNGSGQGKKPGGQNKSQKSGGTDGGDQQQEVPADRKEAERRARGSRLRQIPKAHLFLTIGGLRREISRCHTGARPGKHFAAPLTPSTAARRCLPGSARPVGCNRLGQDARRRRPPPRRARPASPAMRRTRRRTARPACHKVPQARGRAAASEPAPPRARSAPDPS